MSNCALIPDKFALLLESIGRINSTLDLQTLLASIMDAAKVIMEAEASSLMMLDPATNELIIAVPTGPASAEIAGRRIPSGKGFGGWVAAHGAPLVVADASSDPRFFGDVAGAGFRTRTLICVPLTNPQGAVLGVLQALNKRDGAPFSEADIPLFAALAHQAAIAIEKARLHSAALEKEKLEQQLNLARDIQSEFWPKEIPSYPRISLAGRSLPAAHVGGDYYDIIPLDESNCALVIADVSGKGISAALVMAALRAALRTLVESRPPIHEVVTALNRMLVRDTPAERFVTLFWALLNTTTLELAYVNAGHNPPVLFDPADATLRYLGEGGAVLGFVEGLPYRSATLTMRSGEVLVLYTDGVVEAQDVAENMYGEARLIDEIKASAGCDAEGVVGRILRSVAEFSAGAPQYDDTTVVVVKVAQ
jgi:sigma-B regulation protein RsbU (phosphoserine phosphatase)